MKRAEAQTLLLNTAALVAIYQLVRAAFTREVRQQIMERDGWKCVECGFEYGLEASHTDHSRANPDYNNPENGQAKCRVHHYLQHFYEWENNGLSEEHNRMALNSLWSRIPEGARHKYNLPHPDHWPMSRELQTGFITNMADAFKRAYQAPKRLVR